jgi:hypothetical protein
MNSYENLLSRVRRVRRQWRTQVLIRSISLFLVSAVALLSLGVWSADLFGFKPVAVWIIRVIASAAVLFVGWRFVCTAFRSHVSDVQIAQFIEERYPKLEDRLVTAVEYGEKKSGSTGLIDLLIKDAVDKTSRVDLSVFRNSLRLVSYGMLSVGVLLALFALLIWGPAFFPYGFTKLYIPWTEAPLGSSMAIKIAPGDIEIAKGADQLIRARLIGFDSPNVQLYLQAEASKQWNESAMEPDPQGGGFHYLLIDVGSSLRYYAESNGVRSSIHSMRVMDLSRVERIDVQYNFPAYTGMASQIVENDGDISALKGTKIDLRIHCSRPAKSAHLLFDDRATLALSPSGVQDFSGSFSIRRSGWYVVRLVESDGNDHAGSSDHEIEAIEDEAPKVVIARPMRDVRATNVEEVFSEIKAEDDIGIGRLELRYSVNGSSEQIVKLGGVNPMEQSVIGSHTFFLEEFGLQPGDIISYYGKAWDRNDITGPGMSSSDIYFIQIRPFEQKYIQNQQSGMPGGMGDEGQEALSRQQKEIISATFRLIREKGRMDPKEYLDSLKALALVQSRLQAQTQGLVDRLRRRGAEQTDDSFRKLSEYLKNAIGEMEKAAGDLGASKPDGALPQEQKSLQQLMRAESLFREIQVSFASQSGGRGGSETNAEDLADLFELELNKLKNQYETVQREEQQERDQKLDEALQKLKELAQRQQQLIERNMMSARQGTSSSSSTGGGQSQQQLLEQAEQLRRQLQRLTRERSSPQLNEATNQLQKAIDEMKQALKNSQNAAETSAQGVRALQQLNEAMRRLARSQESGLSQGVEQAVRESGKLVEEQKRIQEELDRLSKDAVKSESLAGLKQSREDIVSRKTALADRLRALENQIKDLSRQARRTQKETSSRLADAAGKIQDKRLPDRILSGNSLIQSGLYESQQQRENFIRNGLEEVNKQLEAAQGSIGQTGERKVEEAADRARQLAEGLESMQQRMRGMPNSGAESRELSRNASGPPTGIGAQREEERRQWRSELDQRLTDAQELRPLLDRSGTQIENLDKVIESLRRMGDSLNTAEREQIARLKSAIEQMRDIELELARELDRRNQKDRYFFAEDNESPDRYRKLVEEYYKSIAKSR